MTKRENKSIGAFNTDAVQNLGYKYSTNAPLSSQLANKHLSDITLELVDLNNKTVLDIGCGDGVYTIELFDRAHIKKLVGVDYAAQAVDVARKNSGDRNITYDVQSALDLKFSDNSFDVAILRGVLHHLDDPSPALKEALRVASYVWVIEPNGYNLGLKFLEKFSKYHIEHQEKSYFPPFLDKTIAEFGGKVIIQKWAGFVPMFCPDWLAKVMKKIEPVLESIPLLNRIGCAQYNFLARNSTVIE